LLRRLKVSREADRSAAVSFKAMPFRPASSGVAPSGLKLGAGTAAVVAAVLVAAALPKPGRLAVVATTTGLFGAIAVDIASLVGVTVIAWLLVNGFLVDQLGVLAWHGPADLERLGVLAGAGAIGLSVGVLRNLLHKRSPEEEWRDD
jgi:hypothetical protein